MDRRVVTFFAATLGAILLMTAVKNYFFPPPPAPTTPSVAAKVPAKPLAKPSPEAAALTLSHALAAPGHLLHPAPDAAAFSHFQKAALAKKAEEQKKVAVAELAKNPDKAIVIGNNKVEFTLSEQGAAVKSAVLRVYLTATRDYARPDPDRRPLMLISDDQDGKLKDLAAIERLTRQSFRFLIPDVELTWRLVGQKKVNDNHVVEFEAEAPTKNLRVRKTFTLKPEVYHLEMDLTFTPLKAGQVGEFVYEVTGPMGLEVEGIHWKQSTFRQVASVGVDPKDPRQATRYLDDANNLDPSRTKNTPVQPRVFNDPKNDLIFQFTGVMNQFFAALVIVRNDSQPVPMRLVDRVVPWFVGDDEDVPPYQLRMKLQGKVASKAVSLPVKLAEQPITHQYLLFTGPCKTLLLGYEADTAPGLEPFYTQQHHLRMLTEAPLDNPLSRFSYNIGWSSLVVFCTNMMHRLLEFLYSLFGSYGIAILVMTVIVRACMFPISRKQAQNARDMSEKMARLKPELKKLDEKFKNDSQGKAMAHMELMRKHGVNPLSSCTGCLIVLLQMPVFMGLYYALNESTHLRLAGFLWFPNLAAPDMLINWSTWPVFSSLAQGLNLVLFTLTLGDFFNLLPIVSVTLMYFQQQMMMPPAMDEQQAMQMKMMNWMMLLMGYMFYWVASGLCMYFIVSSAWGMLERKLLPKKAPEPVGKALDKPKDSKNGVAGKARELWQKLLKEAEKK